MKKATMGQRWQLAEELAKHLPGVRKDEVFNVLTELAADGQLCEGVLEDHHISMGDEDIEVDRRHRTAPEGKNLSFLLRRGFRYQTKQGDYYLSGWHIREAIELLATHLQQAQRRIAELEERLK